MSDKIQETTKYWFLPAVFTAAFVGLAVIVAMFEAPQALFSILLAAIALSILVGFIVGIQLLVAKDVLHGFLAIILPIIVVALVGLVLLIMLLSALEGLSESKSSSQIRTPTLSAEYKL